MRGTKVFPFSFRLQIYTRRKTYANRFFLFGITNCYRERSLPEWESANWMKASAGPCSCP